MAHPLSFAHARVLGPPYSSSQPPRQRPADARPAAAAAPEGLLPLASSSSSRSTQQRLPPAAPTRSVRGSGADSPPKPLKTVSFEGCITCRLRKKKCDQGTPACETCQRLNIECLGYQKKRPAFLREKDIAAAVRADLTLFLSRTGKMPNRGRKTAAAAGSRASADADDEVFRFEPYRARHEKGAGAAGSGRRAPSEDSPPANGSGEAAAGYMPAPPARPSATVLQMVSSSASGGGGGGGSFSSAGAISSRSNSTMFASASSSAPSPPSTWGCAPPQADFSVSYAGGATAVPYCEELALAPVQEESWAAAPGPSSASSAAALLPMGADVQYGPFQSPPWQQEALLQAHADIPRPFDSPLLRLNLPREQFELIQIYVTFIDVYASIAVSEQELRQHNKLHHQLDDSDARCDCMDEALVGKTVTYRALQDGSFVEAACALASKYREKKLLCATEQTEALAGPAAPGAAAATWHPPQRNDEADAFRRRAYSTLLASMHTREVDLITALFTCQRLIWSCVYDGGLNTWGQPLLAMRWCIQGLVQSMSSRGLDIADVQSMDPRILFLLRRVVTIDIAATISQESSTPLYPFYQALLTSPHFHLSTGSDLLSHVSSSNIICRLFLEGSVLKAWKRARGPAADPLELAARAAPVQALIDTLLGGSFEESLSMFGYDYFSSPFRTMNFLCSQICAQAGQIYLSSTLHGHDPTHPAIATAVAGVIDLVSILPTKLCLPAIVFPLFLASLYAAPADRAWFVDVLSPATLGAESRFLGNVGPMRLLRDEVWRWQDDWERRGRVVGADRVDWLLVMRAMRMEILLM